MKMVGANPVFNSINNEEIVYESTRQASYKGIVLKTAIFLITAIVSGFLSIFLTATAPEMLYILLFISAITSFVCVLVGMRSPRFSMLCGIIYSIGEGLSLGLLCLIANLYIPGIVMLAVGCLVVVFTVMLILYATGVMRAGSKIRGFVMTVLISYLVITLIGTIMGLFGNTLIYEMLNYGPVAIVVSALLVLAGAFMLLQDFEACDAVVKSGCDKSYEGIAAMGLMVSIVYLFVQILRLLMLLLQRDN